MNPADLIKNLPVVDKALKTKIKQIDMGKRSPTKSKQFNIVKKTAESPLKPKVVPNVEKPTLVSKPLDNLISHATDLKAKKPKPEMKDAETQTDRSDVQALKARLLREKQTSSLT